MIPGRYRPLIQRPNGVSGTGMRTLDEEFTVRLAFSARMVMHEMSYFMQTAENEIAPACFPTSGDDDGGWNCGTSLFD